MGSTQGDRPCSQHGLSYDCWHRTGGTKGEGVKPLNTQFRGRPVLQSYFELTRSCVAELVVEK